MTVVKLHGLQVELDGVPIVRGCDLVVATGEVLGLIGPNGSGKSTLLRAVYRALRPVAGAVHLDGDDVWDLSARVSAQRTAVVAQERSSEFDFSASEVVMMGRGPHKGLLDRDGPEDRAIVTQSLERVGAQSLGQRVFGTLSGGEKQRVLVARALAQRSQVLVLDEPTNHLDVRAQLELLELVRQLGMTTIAALHDLNLAAAYCDRLAVLDRGRLAEIGTPQQVLTPELVAAVFGVAADLQRHPGTGRLHLHLSPLSASEAGRAAS